MTRSLRALRGSLNGQARLSGAHVSFRGLKSTSLGLNPIIASILPRRIVTPSFSAPSAGPSRLRNLSTTAVRTHGDIVRPKPGTGIKVTYEDSKGKVIKTIEGNEGDDLLSLAHEHDIDLEGACERSVACSTCHVIVAPEFYDKLPDPEDDENDMLDLAFGLEDTSRLGCQVILKKELDGMVVRLPSATRNMYVDGAKARTH